MNLSLIIICIVIVISIAFYFFRLYIFNNRLKKHGMVAEAVILDMQGSENMLDNRLRVVLQLQVEPAQGKKFVTEMRQKMLHGEVKTLHPGTRVKVRYNPSNHKQVIMVSS